jgi:50S ribosomal subunit-associated GTPase HflX
LQAYANGVITENPDGYQEQVGKARQAGEPIVSRDRQNLGDAIAKIREQELAEAKAQAEAKPKGKAKAKEPEPELVGVTS